MSADRSVVKSRKVCARCGKQLPGDPQQRVYSTHTRLHYCAAVDACGRRAKRAKKAAA